MGEESPWGHPNANIVKIMYFIRLILLKKLESLLQIVLVMKKQSFLLKKF